MQLSPKRRALTRDGEEVAEEGRPGEGLLHQGRGGRGGQEEERQPSQPREIQRVLEEDKFQARIHQASRAPGSAAAGKSRTPALSALSVVLKRPLPATLVHVGGQAVVAVWLPCSQQVPAASMLSMLHLPSKYLPNIS